MGMTPVDDRLGADARPDAEHGQATGQRGDQSGADPPAERRRGEDQQHRRDGQYAARGGQAVDEDHPQDRDRHEQRLLPAVGRQVVGRQRRRRQQDEDPKRSGLEPVGVEDGEHQPQLGHDRQRTRAADAGSSRAPRRTARGCRSGQGCGDRAEPAMRDQSPDGRSLRFDRHGPPTSDPGPRQAGSWPMVAADRARPRAGPANRDRLTRPCAARSSGFERACPSAGNGPRTAHGRTGRRSTMQVMTGGRDLSAAEAAEGWDQAVGPSLDQAS